MFHKHPYIRKTAAILTAIAAVFYLFCQFLLSFAFSRRCKEIQKQLLIKKHHIKKTPANKLPPKQTSAYQNYCQIYQQWAATTPHQNIQLKSFDHLTLSGQYFYQPDSHLWLIALHGYGSTPLEVYPAAKTCHDINFHVLTPSCRAHAQSGGTHTTMGWHERLDLHQWINWIITKDPQAQIVCYGISMGAATIMMATSESFPPQVRCLIEDCGFTSVHDQLTCQMPKYFHLPPSLFLPTINNLSKQQLKFTFQQASPLKALQNNKTPILFIHSKGDRFVPYEMCNQLYKATNAPKARLIIPDAPHALSHYYYPQRYWSTFINFITQHVDI